MTTVLEEIAAKVYQRRRLTREDALALFQCNDLAWLGQLSNFAKRVHSDNYVYFNVNRHVNLTNVCHSKCKFCAFGCDSDHKKAYTMTKEQVLKIAKESAEDSDLSEFHIVSGLYPDWSFEYYVDIIKALKREMPHIHLKAFSAVEIFHFAEIAGKSVEEVLKILIAAGVDSMPGGGAEILSDRVRVALCPNKATASDWLDTMRTAHKLGLKSNASMLYGHIETIEERVDHLLALRDLQDETGGFQTFICFPFHPGNTALESEIQRTTVWDDLKTIAISRLVLDNFRNIKAYWVMLTLSIAQLALGFGANDMDGTVSEEKIMHAAGAKSAISLTKENLVEVIRATGAIPVERDTMYNVVRQF